MDMSVTGKFKIENEYWAWMRYSILKTRNIDYKIIPYDKNTVLLKWKCGNTYEGVITSDIKENDYMRLALTGNTEKIESEILHGLIIAVSEIIINRVV